MAKKTYEPKEFVWILEVDGEEKLYKVLVTNTECITYEGEKEHKRLKITNPQRKNKVLQIDTVTSVYGAMVPFQLENGIPYIKIDDVWKMSETDREERIARGTRVNKLSAGIEISAGVILSVGLGILYLLGVNLERWWILIPMGVMLIVGGCANLSRLKAELDAIAAAEKEAEERKAEAKAERKAREKGENS